MKYRSTETNRRGHRLAPIACMVLLPLVMAACATKSDIRNLRMDIAALQSKQDSLYRESLRQSGSLADSVRMASEMLRTTRGQLSNQIKQLQDMLVTVHELLGQSQQRINQLREQLERQTPPIPSAPLPTEAGGGDAEALYGVGVSKLQERSAAAARVAFEQFLSQFPQHERAPDAQFGLAETFVLDEALADAVKQFERVSEAYPASARAPEALYRAGEVSEQRKRTSDARRYYNLVVQRYAGTPSARLAQQKLAKLPRS
jgi:tol-pal system protein YbgF